ncbi:PDR/VanB family oxidoreductase [Brevibacillus reuszeri]|uniref:PDR/VanB family oxidoreductase n=1 Tax=Brevibacillus reuszeri TaxID=54915 RepID=UPI002896EEF8|nr:PDR/VanB family oxidoreductase [Brevibacillus reuszeri]
MYRNRALQVRVANIKEETSTIKRFTLQAIDDTILPPFSGGSHITTFLPQPTGILDRHYSVFNLTAKTGLLEIAVRLAEDSTGGSYYWHHHVQVGDVLSVSYPKNYFPLSFQAKHHAFYAAGIGITPFLSMMAELTEKNKTFELHYAAKSKEQCAFYDYLREAFPNQCHFYFSNGEDKKRLSPTQLLNHRIGTHVYFCGPESMIQDFATSAKTYGYPPFHVHFERFAPRPMKEQHAFQIKMKRKEAELEVPANATLLDVLLQNGIKIPYSCRVGGCGTCEIKVTEGEIVHFDSFLSEEQQKSNRTMLSCVSRGKGRLVLDL